MKQVKLLIAGIVAGAALTALAQTGLFDEAAQAKQNKTAWCVDICTQQVAAEAIAAKFK